MSDKAFSILIGFVYFLPLPIAWFIFPPVSTLMVGVYLAVTLWGLWGMYENFRYAWKEHQRETKV